MFSVRKEDLLNISNGISSGALSLDDEIIRKEIIHQLSFTKDVLNFYSAYKSDRSIENFATMASGCNTIGFFASSSIILNGILHSADKASSSWFYGIGFMFHFTSLMVSFYLNDEVKIDQQWLAQLLLCYRSSLLRMILILNNFIEQVHAYEPNADIGETKQILKETEDLLETYDKELDAEQIGTWLQYAVKEDVNMNMAMQAGIACFAVPAVAMSTKYQSNASVLCRSLFRNLRRFWRK